METVKVNDERREQILSILGESLLFRGLKPGDFLKILDIADVLRFDPGEVILHEGDASDAFYVILRGEASIRVRRSTGELVDIGRIPRPASFGEIGLLLGESRTASVTAIGELEVLRFSENVFNAMMKQIPRFRLEIPRGLASRLQQVSGRIGLPDYDVDKGPPSQEAATLLPGALCQRHRVLALEVISNVVTLGMVDDPTAEAIGAVREHLPGMELNTVHISLRFFNEVMQSHAGLEDWSREDRVAPTEIPEQAPQSPRLDALLERVVAEGASDLHLSAGRRPYWRIDGDIREITDTAVLGPTEVLDLVEPVMEERHRDEFSETSDVDFVHSVEGLARFRVNTFRDHNGVGAALRLIPSKILSLEQLGMPPVLRTLCEMPNGLILVTGPTGSGKSTTLAAMIDHIKKTRQVHIVTLEDPIEFVHEAGASLINQRAVGPHTGSFAQGLRAAFREDPDVVLVGELRDLETIALALDTANTGHLVLASLNTNTAVSAVDRIIDHFPADRQPLIRNTLADSLRGVIAQKLLKRAGGGRIAALEILAGNLAVANLIRESKTTQIPNIMQAHKASGMSLLNDELARLVEDRKISLDEAIGAAVDKKDLRKRFRSGVTLSADPDTTDRFRVLAVSPASPGERAGLQGGMLITEIDGIPVREHSLEDARHIFRTDGQYKLSVERGGVRSKVTLELSPTVSDEMLEARA